MCDKNTTKPNKKKNYKKEITAYFSNFYFIETKKSLDFEENAHRAKEMADYLASIFGTEKDKVNCSFYFKIGACRHGEKCSKVHNKPTFSQTVLLKNLYLNPLNTSHQSTERIFIDAMDEEQLQKHFDDIFEELFIEMESKYGEIEEMNICDNLSEHLAGKKSHI